MRRATALALGVGLVGLLQASTAQAPLLEGRVHDPAGAPVAGAALFLHVAAQGSLSDADGSFRLPAPEADDVLVVVKEGFREGLYHVDRSLGTTLDTVIEPQPAVTSSVEVFEADARFEPGYEVEGVAVPPQEPLRLSFQVGAFANGGAVNVTWDGDTPPLRADVVHIPSGQRVGLWYSPSPLDLALPSRMLRDLPGEYQLEARLNGLTAGLDVHLRAEIRYGPLEVKEVRGLPPQVVDPSGDLGSQRVVHPGMDLLGVRFGNETKDDFDVVLLLAELDNPSPTVGNAAVWAVRWSYGGQRYFVAFTAEKAERPRQSGIPEPFVLGRCDELGRCARELVIPGMLLPGRPGALVFRLPKAFAGDPEDGTRLEQPFAVAFQTAYGSSFNEVEADALASDSTPVGAPYVFGAHEYQVSPATLQALMDAARQVGPGQPVALAPTTSGPPAPARPTEGGPAPPWPGLLAVAVAGGAAVVGFGLARRRKGPAASAAGLGKYERVKFLGEGAMGRTYLARHRELDKLVAIKEMVPGAYGSARGRDRFVREARIGGRLRHPNVVEVYDIEEGTDGSVSIVMEYVDGGSLEDRLKEGPLALPDAVRVWRDVLRGLQVIHQAGIVHRDIKTSNILLTRDGTAKLADFGVARSSLEETVATKVGTPVGTPLYMAPEQLQGLEPTPASDLYAATAVAYRMLTGRFHLQLDKSPTPWSLLAAHRERRAPLPLAGLPEWVNGLLAWGLNEEPAARPQSAREMLAKLEASERAQGAPRKPGARSGARVR